jgi:NAD(P)-dependent dehydrogenase (short-subunit alcohol dehydrogenase family)
VESGTRPADVWRQLGCSEASFDIRKKRYGNAEQTRERVRPVLRRNGVSQSEGSGLLQALITPQCEENGMNVRDKTLLITGANRGVGRALVDEALRRGAQRVYAGNRGRLTIADPRVTPLTLDVTNASQIRRAAAEVDNLDVLINNAGIALNDDLSDPALIEQHFAVNFYGPLNLTQALLPQLARAHGTIVNNLTIGALASIPVVPAYCLSKAAMLNTTQFLRAMLASRSIKVHSVLLGPIDTDMSRSLEVPKTPPQVAAQGIFDGLEKGEEDIFPDAMSQSIAESWRAGAAKALERQFAAFVPQSTANTV